MKCEAIEDSVRCQNDVVPGDVHCKEHQYPEHQKLQKVKDKSQAIGEFIDYGGFTLCEYKEAPDVPQWIDERTGTDKTPRGRDVAWLGEHTVQNPDWYPSGYYAVHKPITQILADYFDIDLDKIEQEKRQMLDSIREANAA